MTAFQGTYSDLKFIKTRKVAQVWIEIPIEMADAVIAALGAPNPSSEVWVGFTRLVAPDQRSPGSANGKPSDFGSENAGSSPAPGTKERRPFNALPAPQQAGIICADPIFWAFLREEVEVNEPIVDAESAAAWVRFHCGVDSRSELTDRNRPWQRLRDDFQAWKAAEGRR